MDWRSKRSTVLERGAIGGDEGYGSLPFEKPAIGLLFAMGYGGSRAEAAQVTKKSGDNGIDGVINEDRLGLDVIYVQAKRWKNSVGRPEIQSFVGALAGKQAHKGVFITTSSSFGSSAVEYAAMMPQKVILIYGVRLATLMIEHDIGVSTSRTIDLCSIRTISKRVNVIFTAPMRRFARALLVFPLLGLLGSARAEQREARLPAPAFEEVKACQSGELADLLKVLKRLEGDYRVVGILQTSRSWIVISKAKRTEEFLLASGEIEAGRAAAKEPAGKSYQKQRGIERSEDYVMASSVSADGTTCSINVGSVFKAIEPRIAIEVHEGEAVSTLELEMSEGKEEAGKKD